MGVHTLRLITAPRQAPQLVVIDTPTDVHGSTLMTHVDLTNREARADAAWQFARLVSAALGLDPLLVRDALGRLVDSESAP